MGVDAVNVTFPWPLRDLSPNVRAHWAKIAKAKKQYREACFYLTKEAKLSADWEGDIMVELTFYRPSRRHHDRDNLLACMKSGLDGMADAMNVNDRRFVPIVRLSDEIGGMVKVRIWRDE